MLLIQTKLSNFRILELPICAKEMVPFKVQFRFRRHRSCFPGATALVNTWCYFVEKPIVAYFHLPGVFKEFIQSCILGYAQEKTAANMVQGEALCFSVMIVHGAIQSVVAEIQREFRFYERTVGQSRFCHGNP